MAPGKRRSERKLHDDQDSYQDTGTLRAPIRRQRMSPVLPRPVTVGIPDERVQSGAIPCPPMGTRDTHSRQFTMNYREEVAPRANLQSHRAGCNLSDTKSDTTLQESHMSLGSEGTEHTSNRSFTKSGASRDGERQLSSLCPSSTASCGEHTQRAGHNGLTSSSSTDASLESLSNVDSVTPRAKNTSSNQRFFQAAQASFMRNTGQRSRIAAKTQAPILQSEATQAVSNTAAGYQKSSPSWTMPSRWHGNVSEKLNEDLSIHTTESLGSGSTSLKSTNTSLSNDTIATVDLVLSKNLTAYQGRYSPQGGEVNKRRRPLANTYNTTQTSRKAELKDYARQPKHERSTQVEMPSNTDTAPREEQCPHSRDSISMSMDGSLSTVPCPPSLHERGHYCEPGAFRMASGGVPNAADNQSVTTTGTARTNQTSLQVKVVEASLVTDERLSGAETCPSEDSDILAQSSRRLWPSSQSPIVSAEPMGRRYIFKKVLNSRKVQCVMVVLAGIFIVLVVGTAFGITGFGNIRGTIPTPAPTEEQDDAPTASPTSQGDLDLEYFLARLPEYSRRSLSQSKSPQSKALAWLKKNTRLEEYSLQKRFQRFSLATLFFSAGGERRWINTTNWLSDDEECGWYSSAGDAQVICSAEGNLLLLDLSQNQLRGTLPPEVALLSNLEQIDFSENILTGFIPSALHDITTLTELTLNDNYLTGTVPSEIGELPGLEVLNLEFNYLAQQLPETLGSLSTLKRLQLDRNQFVGDLPIDFGQMEHLEVMYLYDNNMGGTIPTEWGSLDKLKQLRCDTNTLSGTIPTEVGRLLDLTSISLANNTFTGAIPSEIGLCTQLSFLDLFHNSINGTLPTTIGKLGKVQHLYLEENQLSGSVPTEIGKLSNAKIAWLQENNFTGSLPSEIGLLTALEFIKLSSNGLTGTLPTEIAQIRNLEELSLQSNGLSGKIPSEIGLMTRLTELNLKDNDFSGYIPDEICDLLWTGVLIPQKIHIDCNKLICNCCDECSGSFFGY